MTLVEIIFAVVLISAVAFLGIRHVGNAGDGGASRACELQRSVVQNEVDHYKRINRELPSSSLVELSTAEYLDAPLPTCPVSGLPMTINRNGDVLCDTHPSP
jgi:competence protein ComGC